MDVNFNVLMKNDLFKDFQIGELSSILKCLNAKVANYSKGEFVISAGDKVDFVGIVLEGEVATIREDELGNRNIISKIESSEMFGEAYACAGISKISVSVQAIETSKILIIDYRKIITTCSSACVFHTRLISNMLGLIASKVLMLNQKLDILSKRTTRDKLFAFLQAQKAYNSSNRFHIQFSREQLADYLSVDRSAMTRELSKMRQEGLIKFNKNYFELCY